MGTAFLACIESGAPPFHRELLFSDKTKYSVLTRAFSGRLGRGLANRITRDMTGHEKDLLPFPLQSRFVGAFRQEAIEQKKWELLSAWSGQVAPLLTHTKAADLMNALVAETGTYLNTLR